MQTKTPARWPGRSSQALFGIPPGCGPVLALAVAALNVRVKSGPCAPTPKFASRLKFSNRRVSVRANIRLNLGSFLGQSRDFLFGLFRDLGADVAAKAAPDGYTLLMAS